MRVGLDISKALGPADGIGRYTAGLLGGLAALAADGELAGVDLHLYSLFAPWPAERSDVPTAPWAATPAFHRAPTRAPRTGEVDLFHCTTHSVPIGYHGPLLFTVYDLTFLTLASSHTLANRLHCARGLARALARGATLATISEHSRGELAERLALDARPIAVVLPAVDDRFAPPSAEALARMRGRLGLDRPYLLSVGTREPRKNLPRLIEAFAGLDPALVGDRVLAVAGAEGWRGAGNEPAPELVAERLGLGARVRFLGHVADEELPALYGGAELLAYPSLAEGFGLPPLEAMACGAPVLVSEGSSLPEVVGEAAVRVDPEDPAAIGAGLAILLADQPLRERLRATGLERARAFSWRGSARAWLAACRSALRPRLGLASEAGR